MKNATILLLYLCLCASPVFSQLPNWVWAENAIGNLGDKSKFIATDNAGNVYITGKFDSPQLTFNTTTLVNAGSSDNDVFIAKYAPDGNLLWAKSAGGALDDAGYAISFDANDNVFLTGKFASDSISFGDSTLFSSGDYDVFIVKMSSSGDYLWAQSIGGAGADEGFGIASDSIGNSYVCGDFSSNFIAFPGTSILNTGEEDVFIVKYDPAGNFIWAKGTGGPEKDYANNITLDPTGNIYVSGCYESQGINFGGFALNNSGSSTQDVFIVKLTPSGDYAWAKKMGNVDSEWIESISTDASGNVFFTGYFESSTLQFGGQIIYNQGETDIYLIKLDPDGNNLWTVGLGNVNADIANGLTVDIQGNVYVSGWFESASLPIGSTTLNNQGIAGTSDIFVAKYSHAGLPLWAKSAGQTDRDEAYSIASDLTGNIFLTGRYYENSISFENLTLTNSGFSDIFVAKLSSTLRVQDNPIMAQFTMYPNPASKRTSITLPSGAREIKVYNSVGSLDQIIAVDGRSKIDLTFSTSGIYYVRVFTSIGNSSEVLVVAN